jgi:hypothetical protein
VHSQQARLQIACTRGGLARFRVIARHRTACQWRFTRGMSALQTRVRVSGGSMHENAIGRTIAVSSVRSLSRSVEAEDTARWSWTVELCDTVLS